MENLHDKIINIQAAKSKIHETIVHELIYQSGHRDAINAAADLAIEYEALINVILWALERIIADIDDNSESIGSLYSVQYARDVIANAKGKYYE